jgi:two-component system response regulator FlrC
LLESELFGFERGAFTGATQAKPGRIEVAAGGVLFLDEVAEMTGAVQAKLLRVLQEREFQRLGGTRTLKADVRILAATNRDLRRLVERGEFREDLYYRLHVFEIRLPPLRERPEDILPLCRAFLDEIASALGRPPAGLSREAHPVLLAYPWPGNARELRNVLERASILADGGLITREHLGGLAPGAVVERDRPPASIVPLGQVPVAPPAEPSGAPIPPLGELANVERALVEQALHEARFNKTRAARRLGLTRSQLYVRLRRYGIE